MARSGLTVQSQAEAATALQPGEDILAAKEELKNRLGEIGPQALNGGNEIPNIVGYAIGEKTTANSFTGDLAVKVYVVEKVPRALLDPGSEVPAEIGGFPTDVEAVGEIRAFGFKSRERPAFGGASVGHFGVTAGTLGCLVLVDGDKLCILSNNHVLANVNDASRNDIIIHPGRADGGSQPEDRIGRLLDFVPLDFEGENAVDCAVALTSFPRASPEHHSFVIDTTPLKARLHDPVRKDGRTTGHRLGAVSGLSADIRVRYGNRHALFTDQIQIQGRNGLLFSEPGDSGSLVVHANTFQPVGLLFAGGSEFTFVNPIQAVIDALHITDFLNEVLE